MKTTIYLDVLLLINLFVTYFLLLSTQRLLQIKAKQKCLVFSAVLGSLYSLIILAPSTPAWIFTGCKLLVSALLIFTTFGKTSKKLFVKALVCFYLVNFIYAGLMFAIWYFVSPLGMIYRNGVVYFHLSAIVLCITTIVAYLLIAYVSHLLSKNTAPHELVELQITCNNQQVLLSAFVDTGNHLGDIVTGLPVIVCELQSLKALFPEDVYPKLQSLSLDQIESEYWKKKLYLIPVHTVSGQNILLAFKPDSLFLNRDSRSQKKDAVLALSPNKLSNGEFSALIGNNLL